MLITAITVAIALGDALTPGTQAPAFTPEKFLKGTEVKALETGKVHVIEFWATWCGPCVAAMPHLTQLQKDNPEIAVIGVAGFERAGDADANEKKVRAFLESRGDQVGIAIALDTDGSMAREWMTAAKRNTIPTSFVVGKDGRVVYVGSPNQQLDDAVRLAKSAPYKPAAGAPSVKDAPSPKGAGAPKDAPATTPAAEDVKVEVSEEPTDEKGSSTSTSTSTSTSSRTRGGITETETITVETTVEVKNGTKRTTVKTTTVRTPKSPAGSP
jgi:thiol-disulfide isomerase/thioredoxin